MDAMKLLDRVSVVYGLAVSVPVALASAVFFASSASGLAGGSRTESILAAVALAYALVGAVWAWGVGRAVKPVFGSTGDSRRAAHAAVYNALGTSAIALPFLFVGELALRGLALLAIVISVAVAALALRARRG